MARQVGVLKYSGNLGGISHYKMKGVSGDLAKVANGPSKEQIANDPAFKRTRENNTEFGASAKAGKSLRVGLASVIRNFADSQVTGRITKIFKSINSEGTGARGKRNIDLSANRVLLNDFEFNKNISFSSVFNAPFAIVETGARDESSMDIAAFNPLDNIAAPAGATHFRVMNGLATVSDVRFDNASKVHEVVEPTLNTLNNVTFSGYLPLDTPITGVTSIVSTIAGTPTMTADVSIVNVIGIEFYQEVSGQFYLFASGNAMKVGKIF